MAERCNQAHGAIANRGATRGIDGRIYPWGNEPPDATRCNFNMNVKDTTPVGYYSQQGANDSPYGAADMAGNVMDWCADWYNKKEYATRGSSVIKNPIGPTSGHNRVVRGGVWIDNEIRCRSAARMHTEPHSRSGNRGFRVVVVPPLLP